MEMRQAPDLRLDKPARHCASVVTYTVQWLLLFVLVLHALPTGADSMSDRRAAIGIKLFRATLAADLAIADKTNDKGELLLVLYQVDDRPKADRLSDKLTIGGPIRSLPIRVEITNDADLRRFGSSPPAGIFLTQPPSPDVVKHLVRFGARHSVLIYSPFEGHVELGVPAGLFIAARVRPYVNPKSLKWSGIELKDLFLRVSKQCN